MSTIATLLFAASVAAASPVRFEGTVRDAGGAPVAEIRELALRPGVELVADPPDLAPHYAWADLAVVPLSAGGP